MRGCRAALVLAGGLLLPLARAQCGANVVAVINAPAHGGLGNCRQAITAGGSCTLTCNDGYAASGAATQPHCTNNMVMSDTLVNGAGQAWTNGQFTCTAIPCEPGNTGSPGQVRPPSFGLIPSVTPLLR